MLTVTENAVMMIRDLAAQYGAPQIAGLRICANESTGSLTIETVAQPVPGDQVIDDLGARLFLDSEAAKILEDKALDASVDEQGDVEFVITDRPH